MEQKNLIGVFAIILVGSIAGTWAVTQFVLNPGGFAIPVRINGAGATFPAPLYQKMTEGFNTLTGIQVDYEGIGSGGGINQFTALTVDFGASDPPMKQDEWTAAKVASGTDVLQIPSTIGGVVIIFNLPSIGQLNLTGNVTAGIFATTINTWDDAEIAALNPGVSLPSNPITVVHRSDSSGTTAVFTSFLADESNYWNTTYGASKTISWDPSTVGAKGNSGVAAYVTTNQYAIGYCELAYAVEGGISNVHMKNADDNFVSANLTSIADAAAFAAQSLPAGDESWANVGNYFNLSAGCEYAYPISSFSYLLVYKELNVIPGMTTEKAYALVNFLWYAIHLGQQYAAGLHYVNLPSPVVQIDETSILSITFNGAAAINFA